MRTRHFRPVLVLCAAVLAVPLALTDASAAPTGVGAAAWRTSASVPETSGGAVRTVRPDRFRSWTLDRGAFTGAAAASRAGGATTVSLPGPDGGLQRFALQPTTVMEAGLAALHPEISTWAGRGLDDPAASVRVDLGPLGLHASVRSPGGAWYVDPAYTRDRGAYLSYWGRDLTTSPHGTFTEQDGSGLADAEAALGDAAPEPAAPEAAAPEAAAPAAAGPSIGGVLRTYRLALVSDPSYAEYFGTENVLAAKVALINRVDQIYEDDLSIRLVLIDGTDRLNLDTPARATGANGPCGTEPCFLPQSLRACTIQGLLRNTNVLGRLVGADAYDIGHLALGNSGGGVAGLGVVGGKGKAIGCTGIPTPVGDFYAVDYVAHEIGHQFGGNHTFNGVERNCSGRNRNAATSVEPGSGSSIMAYAGICAQDDLQPHSDPYFSERSLAEITAFTRSRRPAVSELQTVWLRGFSGSDAFRLTFRGATTRPIIRGENYTEAGIRAALKALPTVPAGADLTVTAIGGARTRVDDGGFQVFFGGSLGEVDVPSLALDRPQGVTGTVAEARHGGPATNAGVVTPTGNTPPVVKAPASHVIPVRTPFALQGTATDADGDVLTYLWEQNDAGGKDGTALLDPVKRDGPLFRMFGTALDADAYRPGTYGSPGVNAPSTNPRRVFPDLRQVLAGNTNARTGDCVGARPGDDEPASQRLVDCYSEFLPTSAYTGQDGRASLHFRLTARDNRPGGGGVASADTTVQVAATGGPFLVTSQTGGEVYRPGSTQTVRWDVAGTSAAPVGATQVRVTLSRDGGRTWPVVLAEATPNDGAQSVTVPPGETATARIRVEAVGNVFFAVNAAPFTVTG